MGTIRRKRHSEKSGRITQEAIDAYAAGDWMGVMRALRLPPWQANPLDAVGPPRTGDTAYALLWGDSVALREALEAAIGQRRDR
ncbi:MAG: hypothetical protein QM601_02435 [Pseudoxanthomonas sp.]